MSSSSSEVELAAKKTAKKKTSKKKGPVELTPEAVQAVVNKKWGEGTFKFASDKSLEITRIPTGILSLDIALGGGVARGRHFEIYGPYSVGKTYVTFRLIAKAQSMGINCCFVDVEDSFDPVFAAHAGVNLKKLAFHEQREHGNRVIDFMETLLRSRQFGVIALDSIASLLPKEEREQDMEKGSYGTSQAKMMSAAMRRLTAANEDTALIYINQLRDAIGSMFGPRSVTSGGRAMSFYAGTRLELVRTETLKRKKTVINQKNYKKEKVDVPIAHRVMARIEKDKTGGAKQHTTTTFVFNYEKSAIDEIEDLIFVGRQMDLVGNKGNFFWVDGYEDEKQNGRAKFRAWLRKNVAIREELEELIWEQFEADKLEEPDLDDEDDDEEEDDEDE